MMTPMGPEPSILFVCTGNRCRSIAAAALWKARLQQLDENWAEWRISSAGTWAEEGEPPPRALLSMLLERGLDVGGQKSRRLTRDLMAAHRLVLVMEPGHKEALGVEFPELKDRVYLLSEMAGHSSPVADPEGGDPEAFAACIEDIEALLDQGEDRIMAHARGHA
ncbi:MAG: hypothetical protein SCM96_09660 [Acidobacteriota bacterium]|nr:hypothetical protein [Acidobacteriota bacterium]